MDEELRAWMAEATGSSRVERGERIQSLWSGYGELVRLHLIGAERGTAIMKWVKPGASLLRRDEEISHARKCRSYDVETTFYRSFAPRCDAGCRVPRLLGDRVRDGQWLLLLEDLDAAGLTERRRDPSGHELEACLAWLASFHARFVGARPEGLWPIGTYWHLDTRRNELAAIRDAALRERAPELDRRLRETRFQTLVHGDAKPANFCFAPDGKSVAAVDFQYVGGGPGIKDVAYLLHGSASPAEEERSLAHYFDRLRQALPPHVEASALEHEWRGLYPVACDDFRRFLAGWRG